MSHDQILPAPNTDPYQDAPPAALFEPGLPHRPELPSGVRIHNLPDHMQPAAAPVLSDNQRAIQAALDASPRRELDFLPLPPFGEPCYDGRRLPLIRMPHGPKAKAGNKLKLRPNSPFSFPDVPPKDGTPGPPSSPPQNPPSY